MTMTMLDRPESVVRPRPDIVGTLFRREPLFASAGVLLALLALPTLAAALLDQRTLFDIDIWIKPLKFQVALSVYLLTLAFFATWLPVGMTGRRWYRIYAGVVVAAIIGEMLWIGGAAMLGVESHFNVSSPFWSALYAFMGVSAVTLTSATLVYGVQIYRNRATGLSPAMKASIVQGLVLTFVLTVVVAGTMSSNGSHFIGGNLSDTEGAPLFGWARDGGDLRVAHLFATHAMHIIPVFGLISARLLGPDRVAPVGLFSLAFVALVVFAFVQALMGQPFLPAVL